MSENQYIDIVFDGPPSHESGRFVEVENEQGQSIKTGEWILNDFDEDYRLRIKVKPGLNALATMINETSSAHGFWPTDREEALGAFNRVCGDLLDGGPNERGGDVEIVRRFIQSQEVRNMGEMLMLATSELAEALEEHRDGKPVFYTVHPDYVTERGEASYTVDRGKPEGLAVELADCIIRCLDTMHSLGVDIEAVVGAKMAYNSTREHKHGKAY